MSDYRTAPLLSQREVAKRLNLSDARVQQIERGAFLKLRDRLLEFAEVRAWLGLDTTAGASALAAGTSNNTEGAEG